MYEWNDKGVGTYINSNTARGGSRTLENEYTDILNIGRIFDVEEKAQDLVDEMQAQVADTLAGDMVTALGGELAKPEGSDMGKEDLVACDPDVIFVVYMAYSGDDPESVMAQQLSLIQDDPAFASLSAVQSGNIHLIMLGDIYASGPRTIDGLRTLAQGMYPDLEL